MALGKATENQLNHPWYIEFNSEKLGKKDLAGGATLDGFYRPAIYLPANLTLEGIMRILAHESVHLMQICKEDLIPGFGYSIWKGDEYMSLPTEHPDYFTAQPWEAEAKELEIILFEHLKSKFPIDN